MHRRDFTKLTALAAAATALRAQTPPPFRYAPVGLGLISDLFMQAVAQSSKCAITGLVSGHAEQKAPKYQQQFHIPQSSVYTYDTFDDIAHNSNIDAVYIGLPNSMHAEYTIRAAEAGKHVLCEKPMAISSAECRSMIDACKQHNVKLMIAYRVHYDPLWTQLFNLLRSGAIGQVKTFDGAFPGIGHGWRLDPKLAGGGSLFDLGIYPLNGIRYLTGEEPSTYAAMAATLDTSGKFQGMEESIEWIMRLPSGILAACGSSYGERGPNYIKALGDKGYLQMDNAYSYDGLHLTGQTTGGKIDVQATNKPPFMFQLEAEHFAHAVQTNTQPKTPGEEGLADMLAMEAIYRAAGTPIA